MGQVTIHTCDRCKHSQNSNGHSGYNQVPLASERPMYTVSVNIMHVGYGKNQVGVSAYWCKSCCLELGIVQPDKPEEKKPEIAPTLEDIIVSIVESVLDNRSDR